jgi:chromosome partitioning protein
MRRISVLNFKGGVGKTTLSTNLGYALMTRGKRVLLVDLETQRNTSSLLPEIHEPTLAKVIMGRASFSEAIQQAREKLFIVPADGQLNEAANHIVVTGMKGYNSLRNATRGLDGFDYLIFDHAPNPNALGEAALLASEEMIIPCPLTPYAIDGLENLFVELGEKLAGLNHELRLIGIVPFMLDRRYERTDVYLKGLEKRYANDVIQAVRTDENIQKSQHFRQTIFEYAPRSKAAEDIMQIALLLEAKEGRV